MVLCKELHTAVADGTVVALLGLETDGCHGDINVAEEVRGKFVVPVKVDFQFIVKEGRIKAEVKLGSGFPPEKDIACIIGKHTLHNAVTAKVDVLEGIGPEGFICADTVVTGAAVTCAQFDGVEQRFCELHEGFVANLPGKGAGGENAPFAAFTKVGCAVKTDAGVEDVLVQKHVFSAAEEGNIGFLALCGAYPVNLVGRAHIVIGEHVRGEVVSSHTGVVVCVFHPAGTTYHLYVVHPKLLVEGEDAFKLLIVGVF